MPILGNLQNWSWCWSFIKNEFNTFGTTTHCDRPFAVSKVWEAAAATEPENPAAMLAAKGDTVPISSYALNRTSKRFKREEFGWYILLASKKVTTQQKGKLMRTWVWVLVSYRLPSNQALLSEWIASLKRKCHKKQNPELFLVGDLSTRHAILPRR